MTDSGQYPRPSTVERRRHPDLWVRSLEWLAVGSWLLLFIALLLVAKAKPQVETFFERYYDLPLDPFWNLELLGYLQGLMALGLGISIIGLFINWRRSRRAEDQYCVSLIILGIISLVGLVFSSFAH
ncbi:hypothetical protein SAMN05660860_01505 [Geoalkalibacter ferrihydriticus]|uniref:Uncharacterized protein n=2 Tax=Geoalkalibacter ferrihydriticus TaxID=392333 RepID=A0A0C2HNB1_9BACT|nr:hypothetical protein [Geoalkalibacter ferrihydriticus]KIH76435.1 hypothetical protein GFER_09455 [Geoalkalibacter ferrihydriticus DSM 17813]SDL94696.1 hypothetical protein SAMN05660860_01505 [Geoalkalibacter ferrihydriticus]